MRKVLLVVTILAVIGAAGMLVAQQEFPNAEFPAVFENDKVVVQEISFKVGEWIGEHSHAGGQLVIILDETKMLYREGGKEVERTFAKGDVFWIDPVKHDHKALLSGNAMLVSLK